jgi:diguanylate cyclase (GGDEF)-like protein
MASINQSQAAGKDFSTEDRMYLRHCIDDLLAWTTHNIVAPLQRALRVVIPQDVSALARQLSDLIMRIYATSTPFDPSEEDLAVLRRALLQRRQAYAAENETLQLKTSHQDILKQLQDRLTPIERLMASHWFLAGKPCSLPRLTDFLSIQEVYSLQKEYLSAPSPEYDEKFGILLSPTQFLPRLALARLESRLRGTSISVAFIDIDDFKSFNTDFGEFVVDKAVLPVFMRCVEAHVYSHGYAFRFGGDEYMLLLPNLTYESAVANCKSFQDKLPDLAYPALRKHLTVSIGLCTAGPDSPLTERELQKRATDAKKFAKESGKNCIAWMDGDVLVNTKPIVHK